MNQHPVRERTSASDYKMLLDGISGEIEEFHDSTPHGSRGVTPNFMLHPPLVPDGGGQAGAMLAKGVLAGGANVAGRVVPATSFMRIEGQEKQQPQVPNTIANLNNAILLCRPVAVTPAHAPLKPPHPSTPTTTPSRSSTRKSSSFSSSSSSSSSSTSQSPPSSSTPKKRSNRPLCRKKGCPSKSVQGGLCIKHGAKRKRCKSEGCTKTIKKGGFCSKHGTPRPKCSTVDCPKIAVVKNLHCHKCSLKVKKKTQTKATPPVNHDLSLKLPPPISSHTRGLSIFNDTDIVEQIVEGLIN
ncbi:hypothetical protein TrLO_g6301 [Triparma laevis f. longispina]|uniref:WRKY19-like zinc finger domain-containing protein n=1 Tax=Triparma laevis f. longispina TaxID=1714387 RepID=A0A9W7KYM0_9STRA|nr:hypothetical protein TrLO_g6301 [Triparma laevis f. longispina]